MHDFLQCFYIFRAFFRAKQVGEKNGKISKASKNRALENCSNNFFPRLNTPKAIFSFSNETIGALNRFFLISAKRWLWDRYGFTKWNSLSAIFKLPLTTTDWQVIQAYFSPPSVFLADSLPFHAWRFPWGR